MKPAWKSGLASIRAAWCGAQTLPVVGQVAQSAIELMVRPLTGVSRALNSNFSSVSQLSIEIHVESCQPVS